MDRRNRQVRVQSNEGGSKLSGFKGSGWVVESKRHAEHQLTGVIDVIGESNDIYGSGGAFEESGLVGGSPDGGSDVVDLPVGHGGQSGENVAEVVEGLPAPCAPLRCSARRLFASQYISIGYLIPAHSANAAPLIELRTYSASISSRRSRETRARPCVSTFSNCASPTLPSSVDVIAPSYDTSDA